MYIYMCVYIYIYIYIHTHTHTTPRPPLPFDRSCLTSVSSSLFLFSGQERDDRRDKARAAETRRRTRGSTRAAA